jgi:hypothetical protein
MVGEACPGEGQGPSVRHIVMVGEACPSEGRGPAIHVFFLFLIGLAAKTWMAGPSPAMTSGAPLSPNERGCASRLAGHALGFLAGIGEDSLEIPQERCPRHGALHEDTAPVQRVGLPPNQIEL